MYEVTLTKAVRYNGNRYEATDKITVDEEVLEQLQQKGACTDVTEVQKKAETKPQRKTRKNAADDAESGE